MNNNDDLNELNRIDGGGELRIPAKILLSVIAVISGVFSALSPFGFLGILATAIGAGCLAVLLVSGNSILPALCLPLTAAAGWFIYRDVPTAIMSVAYVFAALGIFASRRSASPHRSSATVITAFLLGLCAAGVFAVSLYSQYGTLGLDTLSAFYSDCKQSIYDIMAAMNTAELAAVNGGAVNTEAMAESMIQFFELSKPLLPSIAAAAALISAYVCTWAYSLVSRIFSAPDIPGDEWKLQMSAVSAVIFLTSSAVTAISSLAEPSVVFYSAMNISIVLAPAFIVAGWRAFRRNIRQRRELGKNNVLMILLSVMLFIFNLFIFLLMMAITGAIDTLITCGGNYLRDHEKEINEMMGGEPPFGGSGRDDEPNNGGNAYRPDSQPYYRPADNKPEEKNEENPEEKAEDDSDVNPEENAAGQTDGTQDTEGKDSSDDDTESSDESDFSDKSEGK